MVFLLVYSGLNFLLVPSIDDPRNIKGNKVCAYVLSVSLRMIEHERDRSHDYYLVSVLGPWVFGKGSLHVIINF